MIDGCGTSATIPLATELPAAPRVTAITRVRGTDVLTLDGTGDVALIEFSGLGGILDNLICLQPPRSPLALPAGMIARDATFEARGPVVEHTTPFGPVHVWRSIPMRASVTPPP